MNREPTRLQFLSHPKIGHDWKQQHTAHVHGEKWKGTENVYQKLLNFRHNKFISKNMPLLPSIFIKMSIKACL